MADWEIDDFCIFCALFSWKRLRLCLLPSLLHVVGKLGTDGWSGPIGWPGLDGG